MTISRPCCPTLPASAARATGRTGSLSHTTTSAGVSAAARPRPAPAPPAPAAAASAPRRSPSRPPCAAWYWCAGTQSRQARTEARERSSSLVSTQGQGFLYACRLPGRQNTLTTGPGEVRRPERLPDSGCPDVRSGLVRTRRVLAEERRPAPACVRQAPECAWRVPYAVLADQRGLRAHARHFGAEVLRRRAEAAGRAARCQTDAPRPPASHFGHQVVHRLEWHLEHRRDILASPAHHQRGHRPQPKSLLRRRRQRLCGAHQLTLRPIPRTCVLSSRPSA